MPILREWRAEIRRERTADYLSYTQDVGLTDYRATPGNLGAVIAVRDIDATRTEVVTMSLWSCWEAVRAYAGPEPERARYYPNDDQFLLTRPRTVKHYEVFGEMRLPLTR
jgi:hypothetical protein